MDVCKGVGTATRRTFLAAAAALGVGATVKPAFADEVAWDGEYDFVVAGGGCGAFAALVAANAGLHTLIVEKGNSYGGTTAHSGNGMWVPNNDYMADSLTGEGYFNTPDSADMLDAVVDYAMRCNVYGEADQALVEDYVTNISTMVSYLRDTFGMEFQTIGMVDYYPIEGAKAGRAIRFCKDGEGTGTATFETIIQPACEAAGVEVVLNTEATALVQDESGRVIGIEALNGDGQTVRYKAEKGVLLNTGGFEHNEKMRKTYLHTPIVGANSVPTNTGDGHRMAVAAGADLGNMSCLWGVPFYQTVEGGELFQQLVDWMHWRYGDHSIIVSKAGQRFADETLAYAPANDAFYNYDGKVGGMVGMPAFHIGDQSFVEMYGYPGASDAETLPDCTKVYDTLEELAADNGIDVTGLLAQVERWNGFCDAGVDEEYRRDQNPWTDTPYYMHEEGANHLGKIEKAPFFCAKIVPGTCGTNGGIRVNADAQALDANGEPIPGLYASGNCSAAYFGSAYPGPGSTVGSGIYRAVRAANHVADLGIFA